MATLFFDAAAQRASLLDWCRSLFLMERNRNEDRLVIYNGNEVEGMSTPLNTKLTPVTCSRLTWHEFVVLLVGQGVELMNSGSG